MNIILSAFLLLLLQTDGGKGSINVLVVDSTGNRPIASSVVTLNRVTKHGNENKSEEVASKKTDARGIASFKDVLPGDYLIGAATPELDKSSWKFGTSIKVHVTADSTVKVVIPMKPAEGAEFSNEKKYRMKILPPDTLNEEEMPIYNPERKRSVPGDSL